MRFTLLIPFMLEIRANISIYVNEIRSRCCCCCHCASSLHISLVYYCVVVIVVDVDDDATAVVLLFYESNNIKVGKFLFSFVRLWYVWWGKALGNFCENFFLLYKTQFDKILGHPNALDPSLYTSCLPNNNNIKDKKCMNKYFIFLQASYINENVQ